MLSSELSCFLTSVLCAQNQAASDAIDNAGFMACAADLGGEAGGEVTGVTTTTGSGLCLPLVRPSAPRCPLRLGLFHPRFAS